ncbi:vitamin B6 photo-protection and homoeostasis-domain-containing protein [Geopyxis carbonaria]|nr:vitamin B6 photo-protection and homoeostasis-domain-containing protein [Geopyxis carbonaria]
MHVSQDSLQAFSSSIAGLLTSRAVLEGFGVGDANASATSALLLTILQDCVGRFATIIFAYRFGIALEAECKKYRFLADIFNDSAMVLDCLSPAFPRMVRVSLLCLSGSLRALCGVAGGASKASLSVHFAKMGNVGELNAKDSSQETVISLLGMLAGSVVVSRITSPSTTWFSLIFLLGVHLATNYKAVRCVALRTLNRQRTCILFSWFQKTGTILSPKQVACRERVLEKDGVLRWGDTAYGSADVGMRFATILASLERVADNEKNSALELTAELAKIFRNEKFLLWPSSGWGGSRRIPTNIHICLKEGATARDQVKAWSHALLVSREISSNGSQYAVSAAMMEMLRSTLCQMDECFSKLMISLVEGGWDLETAAIETRSGYRLAVILDPSSPDGTVQASSHKEQKKNL